MSNAEHTKGAWLIGEPYQVDFATRVDIHSETEWDIVARVCVGHKANHTLNECGWANARLIAAAPELLEALIDVSNQARHSDYDWPVDLARAVSAAIAKATGEQA